MWPFQAKEMLEIYLDHRRRFIAHDGLEHQIVECLACLQAEAVKQLRACPYLRGYVRARARFQEERVP